MFVETEGRLLCLFVPFINDLTRVYAHSTLCRHIGPRRGPLLSHQWRLYSRFSHCSSRPSRLTSRYGTWDAQVQVDAFRMLPFFSHVNQVLTIDFRSRFQLHDVLNCRMQSFHHLVAIYRVCAADQHIQVLAALSHPLRQCRRTSGCIIYSFDSMLDFLLLSEGSVSVNMMRCYFVMLGSYYNCGCISQCSCTVHMYVDVNVISLETVQLM